jgi:hypothetical protein
MTEAWGSAYLHVLTVLLVFALGLPEVLYQLSIPEDVRRIAQRHLRMPVSLVVALCVVCVVWVVVLWGGRVRHVEVVLQRGRLVWVGDGGDGLWRWGVAMVIALGVVLWSWQQTITVRRGDELVSAIGRKLVESARAGKCIAGPELEDLAYLGEKALAGTEKDGVLKCLIEVGCERIKGGYEGDGLGPIVSVVVNAVYGIQAGALGGNLTTAEGGLRELWELANAKSKGRGGDGLHLWNGLAEVGKIALRVGDKNACMEIVRWQHADAAMLYRMGTRGLEVGDMEVAVAALSEAENLVQRASGGQEGPLWLRGLQARIRTCGDAERLRCDVFERRRAAAVTDEELLVAIRHHRENLEFRTVNALFAWRREVSGLVGRGVAVDWGASSESVFFL